MLGIGVAVATLLAGFSAVAQTAPQQPSSSPKQTTGSAPANVSKADQHFVTEAIQADLAEMQIGKLAQQKGESADVKQYGQMLEQDHGQHLQQAQQVANQIGVTAPAEPSSQQKAIYDKLSKLSGPAFDRQFAMAMMKDHKEDVAKFLKMAKQKNAVGEFAGQTVPTLQKHLQSAEALTSSKPSKK
jgi:putative membrane protein